MACSLAVILLLLYGSCNLASAKKSIHILGLYPLTGSWPAGRTILGASQMAVDHVNEDPTLLQDYEIVLVPSDSAVSLHYSFVMILIIVIVHFFLLIWL